MATLSEQERGEQGMRCDAQYGQNPDKCYLQFNHRGPHSNRYGTTWTAPAFDPTHTQEKGV